MKRLNKNLSYQKSGVNIDKATEAINLFKDSVSSTFNQNVLNDLSSYAGLFQVNLKDYEEPVLVSSTDGVGTKILLAKQLNDFSTIGQDLVAMCVNDILCAGATPLFFLDYLACGKVVPSKIKQIVESIAQGCIIAEVSLIGGETAEMPGVYKKDDVDLAGFAVGIVDKKNVLNKHLVKKGDLVCALSSSGPHSNGYSLIRKIIDINNLDLNKDYKIENNNLSLGKILLTPTKIYTKPLKKLIQSGKIKGLAHITGGGFYENINRIIPKDCNVKITKDSWKVPEIFKFLQKMGNVDEKEMYRVFNMGLGMVIIIDQVDFSFASKLLSEVGEELLEIGVVTEGNGIVEIF
jgi:phosphoribosylformylglycinamidine cyclo-ligase